MRLAASVKGKIPKLQQSVVAIAINSPLKLKMTSFRF